MALLAMMVNNDHDDYFEVGHVNYHKRESAIRDEKIVRNFCKKHNIVFHKLDVDYQNAKGNFQSYARKIRYQWFKQICQNRKLDYVMLGHQQDDLIETYLMQKNKNVGVSYYGLKRENKIYGVNIVRPLLDYSKKDLLNYCLINNIAYGIDESNLRDDYTRNVVRHNEVEKMSITKRKQLISTIKKENKKQENILLDVMKYSNRDNIEVNDFLSYVYNRTLLRYKLGYSLSNKYLDELLRQLKENNKVKILVKGTYLIKEYGFIDFVKAKKPYSYVLEELGELKTKYFKVTQKGSDNLACCKLTKKDFPITIRSYQEGDCILMRYGHKKINRFFIDKKVRFIDRQVWPIVTNRKGTAILVPGIGCDVDHYDKNPNIYVIKY